METLGNEKITYHVGSSEEAKRLERAVKEFPLTLEIGSFSDSFNPPIYVQEQLGGIVFIQPSQGTFSKLKFGGGTTLVNPEIYKKGCSSLKKAGLVICKVNYIAFYNQQEYWISESSRE